MIAQDIPSQDALLAGGTLLTDLARSQRQAMLGMDVPWLLDRWAERAPDKPFLIWEPFVGEGETWTFARMRSEARAFAAGLHAQGVRKGEFVLLHMDNSPEFLIAWFACAILGAVVVSTNTRSVAKDLAYFAEHTGAVCAITQPSYASLIRQACQRVVRIVVTDNNAGVPAACPEEHQWIPFAVILRDPSDPPERPAEPFASLGVQFTSGTTSRPKAVLWTHANAIWGSMVSAAHMRLQHEDIALVILPLFHTNAQAYSMLTTLWCGGTLVLQPKFSASRFWPVSVKHRITWLSMIPFTIKALDAHAVPPNSYRFWGLSGHLPAVTERFGIPTIGWWGMTETVTQGIVTDLHHPGPEHSMGRVAPEYAIRVLSKGGVPALPGERGRLYIRGVRGVSLFKEYLGDADATASAFDADGWFDTGDVVSITTDGYLLFGDRDKDMLRVGSENVAASEIEAVILQSGLVDECAVVGRPHFMLDEVPVAFVVVRSGAADTIADEIIAHCATSLAAFKVVREVHVVDELPRGLMGKVLKRQLRERLPPIVADSKSSSFRSVVGRER